MVTVLESNLVKTLTRHGNGLALVIDQPVLDLLGIGADTPVADHNAREIDCYQAISCGPTREVPHRRRRNFPPLPEHAQQTRPMIEPVVL